MRRWPAKKKKNIAAQAIAAALSFTCEINSEARESVVELRDSNTEGESVQVCATFAFSPHEQKGKFTFPCLEFLLSTALDGAKLFLAEDEDAIMAP